MLGKARQSAFWKRAEGSFLLEVLGSAWIRARMPLAERSWKPLQTHSQRGLPTLLVTTGRYFYNPPNTALDTVVTFISMPGIQPTISMVEYFQGECLNIHSILGISQEH